MQIEKLRARFGPKLGRLQEKVRKAEQKVDREKSQYKNQRRQTVISFGATLLGALFGRKSSSRVATAARGASRMGRDKADIHRAEEDLESAKIELKELEKTFKQQTQRLQEPIDPLSFELDPKKIRPRKSDIQLTRFDLAWTPWILDKDGKMEQAYTL